MRPISALPGSTTTISSDYPFGQIVDGATPVIEATYSDVIQNLWRFITLAGVVPNNLQDNTTNGFQLSKALQVVLDPVGNIKEWLSDSILPPGYVQSDGRTLSKTTYPDLWNLIGYTFGGSGDNYNIHDTRDKMIVGSGITYIIGAAGGERHHVLTAVEIPPHVHQVQHAISGVAGGQGALAGSTPSFDGSVETDNGSTSNGGTLGGSEHNNMPPYIAMNRIIKIQYV